MRHVQALTMKGVAVDQIGHLIWPAWMVEAGTERGAALSKTGNTNTLAGNVPPKADLGDLRGLGAGLDGRVSAMINGSGDYDGAKAYKDSKVRGGFWGTPCVRTPEAHVQICPVHCGQK